MEWVLRLILFLYPPSFRVEFGDEIAAVFRQSAVEKRAQGRSALAGWLISELFNGLRVALRLWQKDLEQGVKMQPNLQPALNDQAPRWVIPAMLAFFLVISLPYGFYALFPAELSFWLPFILALLTFFAPLLAGLLARLPRWSLLYMGVVLGGVGIYVIYLILGLALWPVLTGLHTLLAATGSLAGRLFYQWIYQGSMWLAIVMANALFLALVAYAPGLRSQRLRFWNDFSLVSFSLYGGILIIYLINFDEYRHEELYVLVSMAALALGAWGYLRAKTPGWRILALLAGLTVCMASMGLGKYFLVPLQDWPIWSQNNPPETERWFESLRTIATWFWAALFVGLPGVIQVLRKTPAAPSALTNA